MVPSSWVKQSMNNSSSTAYVNGEFGRKKHFIVLLNLKLFNDTVSVSHVCVIWGEAWRVTYGEGDIEHEHVVEFLC